MPLLVDAYNALHVTGVLPPALAGPDVDRLAAYIARSRWSRWRTRLICDGQPAGEPPSRPAWGEAGEQVEIVYAGAGREADGLLERLIGESSAPRRLVVVSSDRRVQRAARRRKAQALTSEAFLGALALDLARAGASKPRRAASGGDRAPALPLTPQATDAWIEDLGLSGDPLLALAPSAVPPVASPQAAKAEKTAPAARCDRRAPASPLEIDANGTEAMDPLLEEALEEWSDRLRADDLDMAKWLDRDDTPPDR